MTTYYVWTGEFYHADVTLNKLRKLAKNYVLSPFELSYIKVLETAYFAYISSYTNCINSFTDGLKISQDAGFNIWDNHLLSSAAMCAISCKDLLKAEEFINKMLLTINNNIPYDEMYHHNFIGFCPIIFTELCVKALESGIEVEYVKELIRKRGLFPDTSPHEIENWPWELKIYTLGQFKLEKDGKPIQFSGKIQQKPLEMLSNKHSH